jgi:hypothetical protein
VLLLFENMAVPADHPERFRIEILFCPGTALDPTEVSASAVSNTDLSFDLYCVWTAYYKHACCAVVSVMFIISSNVGHWRIEPN